MAGGNGCIRESHSKRSHEHTLTILLLNWAYVHWTYFCTLFGLGDIDGATHYITGNEYYLEWDPIYSSNKFQVVYFPQDPGTLERFDVWYFSE